MFIREKCRLYILFGAYTIYSVMHSDGNSFCGDVVLGSFNMVYNDEDSIKDQKYEKRILWDNYYEDFKFQEELKNIHYAYFKKYST